MTPAPRVSTAAHTTGVGRCLVLLIMVVAVLIGLLAMHTVTATAAAHGGGTSAMAGHEPATSAVSPAPASADCGGLCDPGHVMTDMTCILALLVIAAMVAVKATRRWASIHALARSVQLVAFAAITQRLDPPDLNALSISRR